MLFLLPLLALLLASVSPVASTLNLPYPCKPGTDGVYHYQSCTFNQPLDHFDFSDGTTFPMRFFINDTWWDSQTPGPIFFYTGNEGPLEDFSANTGFQWEACQEFHCLIVFAEHRYYGETLPNGPNHPYNSTQEFRHLSVEQALADYAAFLGALKTDIGFPDIPIISFGGSYGGMLSAWFRKEYPELVTGSIAGSAPLLQFGADFDPATYTRVCTDDFRAVSPLCVDAIAKSWNIMNSTAATPQGRDKINRIFQSCPETMIQSQSDVENLLWPYITNALQTLTMADYPYPTTFLGDLPGNPVTVACQLALPFFQPGASDDDIMQGVAIATGVFYNSTLTGGNNGNLECNNYNGNNIAALGNPSIWNYQACSELILPQGQYGLPIDMFFPAPFSFSSLQQTCEQQFPGIQFRPNHVAHNYGTKPLDWMTVSRIFFSQGSLDPWRPGGFQTSIKDSLPVFIIDGGAHHLDLRASNPLDPQSVIDCRNLEKQYIRSWLSGYDSPAQQSSDSGSGLATKWVILITLFSTLAGVALVAGIVAYIRKGSQAASKDSDYNRV